MKKDVMTSAPDRRPDELAPFWSAAKPLDRLTSEQGRKIKARALETLGGDPAPRIRWRWSTALAALGLVLFGGVAAAAAARYGLLPWVRIEQMPGPGEREKPRNSEHERTRVRKPQVVAPAVAPAPVVPVSQAREPSSQAGEPTRTPSYGRRAGGSAVKSERSSARSMARADAVTPAPAPSEPVILARQPTLAREVTPEQPAKPAAVVMPSETASAPPTSAPQPSLARTTVERPAGQSTVIDEQAVLSEALRRLRQGHDATGSLALLDQLESSHPHSHLALERANLRVEALLTLGRENEALSRLDGMALDGVPRSAERFLLRGELRARFQRWPEARDDFEHALAKGSGTPTWHERALWGRGVARLRAGDQVGGEADLKSYLASYPSGRHAAEAEKLLAAHR